MGMSLTYHCFPTLSLASLRTLIIDRWKGLGCSAVDAGSPVHPSCTWVCAAEKLGGGMGCILRGDNHAGLDLNWIGENVAGPGVLELRGYQDEWEPWELELLVGGGSRCIFSACAERSGANNPGLVYLDGPTFIREMINVGMSAVGLAERYFLDWKMAKHGNVCAYTLDGYAYEGDLAAYGEAAQICDLFERLGFPEPIQPWLGLPKRKGYLT